MFMYNKSPIILSPLTVSAKIHVLGDGGFQETGFWRFGLPLPSFFSPTNS